MRLLHLSDIHFGGYGPVWDDDDDQREQLLADVNGLVTTGGSIDGILVGGDVAYSGQPNQYARAKEWISRLVEVCGCRPGDVWVVPGNHDIDRARVEESAILQDFRRAVRSCHLHHLDTELRKRLANDPHCEALVSAFAAYNDFALPWGCHVSAQQFHWKDDTLRLGDRRVLLWGINSVLASDAHDAANDPDEGTEANLVLGTRQCQISKAEAAVRIALVHHPPEWLKDWDRVKPYVDRAHVVLFGHDHAYKADLDQEGGAVYVRAGAVGPERGPLWVPSYNLLTLAIAGDQLDVAVEPRRWIPSQTSFGPHDDGTQTFMVALREDAKAENESKDVAVEPDEGPANATPLSTPSSEEPGPASGANTPAHRRELVFSYLSAPVTRREVVARKLGVFEEDDVGLPEGEFYAAILRRVRDRGLIDDLAKELRP
jgi:3',5'-cyclic AMP phosphodiesterase CpdA